MIPAPSHPGDLRGLIRSVFSPHSHDASDKVDRQLEASQEGMRALKISLVGLALTAAFQGVIVLISGSVALLADTIHNFSDALTALPLGFAFWLGRRYRSLVLCPVTFALVGRKRY